MDTLGQNIPRGAFPTTKKEFVSILEMAFAENKKQKRAVHKDASEKSKKVRAKKPGKLLRTYLAIVDVYLSDKENKWVRSDSLANNLIDKDDYNGREAIRRRILRINSAFGDFFTENRSKVYGYKMSIENDIGYEIEIKDHHGDVIRQYRMKLDLYPKFSHVSGGQGTPEYVDGFSSRFNIPHASLGKRFVGRQHELEALDNALNNGQALAVAVHGIAGIGKTQLAAEYAHRMKEKYPGGCFWVAAETRGFGSSNVTSSFATLQVPLGLTLHEQMREFEQGERVLDTLRGEQRLCLIIFDNADNWGDIRDWIHALSHHHILITTRDPEISVGINELLRISVSVLDSVSSLAFLFSCCEYGHRSVPKIESQEYNAGISIVERLGRLPLALELAASYLKSWPEITFFDYDARLIREGLIDTIDSAGADFTHSRHVTSVRATLQPIWENLMDKPDSRRLVSCVAHFGSQPIRPDVLSIAARLEYQTDRIGHPSPFDRALSIAVRTSLVERTNSGNVTCHRLIRDFVRSVMNKSEQFVYRREVFITVAKYHLQYCRSIGQTFEDVFRSPYPSYWIDVLESVEYLGLLDEYARLHWQNRQAITLPTMISDLSDFFERALFLLEKAEPNQEATSIYESAIHMAKERNIPDEAQKVKTLSNLALLYTDLGRYAEAETLYELLLRQEEKVSGERALSLAMILIGVGDLYLYWKGKDARIPLSYRRAIAIFKKSGYNVDLFKCGVFDDLVSYYETHQEIKRAQYYRGKMKQIFFAKPDDPDIQKYRDAYTKQLKRRIRYRR